MSRILITGATGKVGTHLTHQLQSAGHPLRVAVHSPEKADALLGPDTQIAAFDFDRPETIRAALDGIDTVYLLTPPDERQVDWAIKTIDLAKAAGVRRIVRMSVLAAAMEPGIRLGRWHRTVERYLVGSGLETTIVRPGPFFQNFSGMYPGERGGFSLPVGDAQVTHIHVQDVARALAAVATGDHSGKTYMVTGDTPMTLAQSAAALGRSYRTVTPDQAREAFLAGGRPSWFVDIILELFAAFGTGAVGLTTSTFKDLTGRDPLSIEDYAAEVRASRAA